MRAGRNAADAEIENVLYRSGSGVSRQGPHHDMVAPSIHLTWLSEMSWSIQENKINIQNKTMVGGGGWHSNQGIDSRQKEIDELSVCIFVYATGR